jgi:glycosyltransferase involved in cell wall biosynthesis
MTVSEDTRIRVLILIDAFVNGGAGAERVAIGIAVHLPPQRYAVHVCTTRRQPDASLAAALEHTGVRHLDLARSGRLDVLAFRRLIRLLRDERIDVLHAHMFGSNLWGVLFGRLCRVPVVIAHEHSWSYAGEPLRRLLDGAVISRLADTFVAVSQADRDRMVALERVRRTKITVIPTAYIPLGSSDHGDVRAELGIDRSAPVVGTVALLRPQKALEVLVEAFSLLPDRLSNARLVIAGDGPCRAALEAQALRMGLRDRVHFLGMRRDPDAVWRAFDVAAMSSDWEGMPLAAIEAMTHGIPLVATCVGGVPELLEDEVSALLVQPRDPEALAAALVRLVEDAELRTRLAGAAKRVSRGFSLERLMTATEEMYLGLLAGARRGRRARIAANTTNVP